MNKLKILSYFVLNLLVVSMLCEGVSQGEALKNVFFKTNHQMQECGNCSSHENWLYYYPEISQRIEEIGDCEDFEIAEEFAHHIYSASKNSTAEHIETKAHTATTYAVKVMCFEGFWFHIAAYSDANVVTCLDGPMIGCQAIEVSGNRLPDCYNVTWHKDHFVHKHPWGKVCSYPQKQITKFN